MDVKQTLCWVPQHMCAHACVHMHRIISSLPSFRGTKQEPGAGDQRGLSPQFVIFQSPSHSLRRWYECPICYSTQWKYGSMYTSWNSDTFTICHFYCACICIYLFISIYLLIYTAPCSTKVIFYFVFKIATIKLPHFSLTMLKEYASANLTLHPKTHLT